MIHDIIKNFGAYLTTSAGYSQVFYNQVQEKGGMLNPPYAEIWIDDTNYPIQANLGIPAISHCIFKSYFRNTFENGTVENMELRSQKEIEIYQMFHNPLFLSSLQDNNNSFVNIDEVIPATNVYTDINGITNNLIMVDYRFDILWRVI